MKMAIRVLGAGQLEPRGRTRRTAVHEVMSATHAEIVQSIDDPVAVVRRRRGSRSSSRRRQVEPEGMLPPVEVGLLLERVISIQ